MTTTPERTAEEADNIIAAARAHIAAIEAARDTQPERLAKARSEADEARGWALIEEPWSTLVSSVTSVDGRASLTLPSITAKELMGARLAFDVLDAGGRDDDTLDEVQNRYFTELGGDTGVLYLVCMAALNTIADLVVPQMLEDLEARASNYDARFMLAEARAKAWNGRVSELRGPHDRTGHTE